MIAANLVPIGGVLFFGWNLGDIMLLYWALVISHGISFYTNFLGAREYEGATVSGLMTAPYNRVIVMQLTLILGGWIILLFGMPAGALIVLVLLKTMADLQAHRKEHKVA